MTTTQKVALRGLLNRLKDSKDSLNKVAAQWLCDDFYFVAQQIQIVQSALSKNSAYPSIYDLLLQMIKQNEGYWDLEHLTELIQASQGVSVLTLSELWAIPVLLRLALLEHLSHMPWADEEDALQQASHRVNINTTMASLRRISAVDWRKFVENTSLVENTLRQDPSDTYQYMDFTTRNSYRQVVEHLARASQRSEIEVALSAIQLAKKCSDKGIRQRHVGYYLIDAGLALLQQTLGIRKTRKKLSLFGYLGAILAIVVGVTAGLLFKAYQSDVPILMLVMLGAVMALSVSQSTIALVNWVVMLFIKPEPLPRMDFSKEIPASCQTLVVVPSMLGSVAQIESLVEALEVRYLGNRDHHLHFALLTDFNDAPSENMPTDEKLLAVASARIMALNKRYCRKHEDIFFLLHRPRRWNDSEQVWMGYERKRGKLNDLNALLCDNIQTNFSLIAGRIEILAQVKYVITLDTDTQLPRESAHQLIGVMAHPLNRPYYDPKKQRVVAGFGMLQPRMAEAWGKSSSRYLGLLSSEVGIDPYTQMVSNVYQDLFNEGSFIGKGIYDVEMFKQVLAQRFPENRILSHDLLEGCYLRSGFISDVPLYETSPSCYLSDVKRRARWIRGDWQLIPGISAPELSALSQWKLLDNLRRSLVPMSLLVFFILSWTLLPETSFWVCTLFAIVLLPGMISTALEFSIRPHLKNLISVLCQRFYRLVLYLACLPHEAYYSLNGIIRTGYRLMCSHRHLLEWTASDHVDQSFHNTPIEWLRSMWMGPVAALLMVVTLLLMHKPEALLLASPLLLLWAVSPLLTRWLSQPIEQPQVALELSQKRFLHKMARKTWDFFDTFVTAQDNGLPPDNYQEAPVEVLCHRTSPTNMGLALLANLSAYDFGYITSHQLLERTAKTLNTMARLERYRGHFYNWYDTQTLEPLAPRYVSTVDGGNLAGHLLTLRQGLLALLNDSVLRVVYLEGLEDTLDVLVETISEPVPAIVNHFRVLLHDSRSSFTSESDALRTCDKLCLMAKQITVLKLEADFVLWSQKLLTQCDAVQDEIMRVKTNANNIERIALIENLAEQAYLLAQMDVKFLYNETLRLMTIGYNVDEQQHDNSHYDLLSSEARLANFVAIAQGQVPQESWFALGRLQRINQRGQSVMMSWSGSMFEYLMPVLVMPTYSDTLLDQTYKAVVNQHIDYGQQQGVPWGISESGYNDVDADSNYLYQAFGVPELGLKREVKQDLVIAPYACVMALMIAPQAACVNLLRLAQMGSVGRFGFYEAIDFTESRRANERTPVFVRSFMVHHQGMSLLAFSHLLHNQPMQRRFASDPLFQSTLLLLQERIPKSVVYQAKTKSLPLSPDKTINDCQDNLELNILSNGRYHVMLTRVGNGYSRWKDLAVTRWRAESVAKHWGMQSYLYDSKTGNFWTVGSDLSPYSRHHEIGTHTEIIVSPEEDMELRRIGIHNRSNESRTIEFTSYAEVVLAAQGDDEAQPAFSNLFVETQWVAEQATILATRRRRSEKDDPIWMYHKLNVYTKTNYRISFETNRGNFIGRGGTPLAPTAMKQSGDLSNTVGTVLDPIVAIRCQITLKPNERIVLDLINGVTSNRDEGIRISEKYYARHWTDRQFELAKIYQKLMLQKLNIAAQEAKFYMKLAAAIIYVSQTYRAQADILASNRHGQSNLWAYSISGDLPIVLLHIENAIDIDKVQQLLHAQAYWRFLGLNVDLVILNEAHANAGQILQEKIMSLIHDKKNIYVLRSEQIPSADHILLQSVARVVLLAKQL